MPLRPARLRHNLSIDAALECATLEWVIGGQVYLGYAYDRASDRLELPAVTQAATTSPPECAYYGEATLEWMGQVEQQLDPPRGPIDNHTVLRRSLPNGGAELVQRIAGLTRVRVTWDPSARTFTAAERPASELTWPEFRAFFLEIMAFVTWCTRPSANSASTPAFGTRI